VEVDPLETAPARAARPAWRAYYFLVMRRNIDNLAPRCNEPPLVSLRNVSVALGANPILRNLDADIEARAHHRGHRLQRRRQDHALAGAAQGNPLQRDHHVSLRPRPPFAHSEHIGYVPQSSASTPICADGARPAGDGASRRPLFLGIASRAPANPAAAWKWSALRSAARPARGQDLRR